MMKQQYQWFYFLLILLTFQVVIQSFGIVGNQAQASPGGSGGNFYIEETLLPVLVNRNDTSSITTAPGVATESGLGYDLRTTFGYTFFSSSFLVGLSYNMYHLQTKRSAITGGDSGLDETTDRYDWGPTLGWLGQHWRVLITILSSGQKKVSTKNSDDTGATTGDVTITNTGVSGYQFVVGYSFPVTSNFSLGPSIVYYNVAYGNQAKTNALNSFEDYSETSLYTKSVKTSLDGMISLNFRF